MEPLIFIGFSLFILFVGAVGYSLTIIVRLLEKIQIETRRLTMLKVMELEGVDMIEMKVETGEIIARAIRHKKPQPNTEGDNGRGPTSSYEFRG